MTDFLLQEGISNLCISLTLTIVAWTVHTNGKRPLLGSSLFCHTLLYAKTHVFRVFLAPHRQQNVEVTLVQGLEHFHVHVAADAPVARGRFDNPTPGTGPGRYGLMNNALDSQSGQERNAGYTRSRCS